LGSQFDRRTDSISDGSCLYVRRMTEQASHQGFWTEYQPGFRFTDEPVGTPEFFLAVERHRYSLEPAIPQKARFGDWAGRDALEAGCGIATDGINFARHGANYTDVDFSDSAVSLAQRRFELEGLPGRIAQASVTELPVAVGAKTFCTAAASSTTLRTHSA
jgi:SAM-dependent methyltransferase